MCAGETLEHLAWSPNNGLAAVTGLPRQQLADGRFVQPSSNKQHKLYVLEPEQQLASITLQFEQQGSVIWSPAGDRILMEAGHALELDTKRCTLVPLLVQQYGASSACFSPDGRHCALVKGCRGVKICKAADGSQVFSLEDDSMGYRVARFSDCGAQLLLSRRELFRVIDFGWETTSSRAHCKQICSRITAAVDWASTMGHSCCKWEGY